MSFPKCPRCDTPNALHRETCGRCGWVLSRCYTLDVDLAELEERDPAIRKAAEKLAVFERRLRGKLDA